MSNSIFKELLQSSRNLIKDDYATSTKGPLDRLVRGVGQISIESDLLASKHAGELGHSVHNFLSKSGVNTQDIAQNLKSIDSNTFQRTTVIVDHDIESYLQRYEEKMVLETIAEARKSTRDDFEEAMDRELQFNWRNDQRKILEDWDREQENILFGANMHTKDMKEQELEYAKAVTALNRSRLLFQAFPLVETFQKLSLQKRNDTTEQKAWGIISCLTKSKPIVNGWASSLRHKDISLFETRCRLIDASRNYLEKEFLDYIYDFLRRNAEEIRVGGIPSVQHRIMSYMKYILRKKELDIEELEYINEIPFWFYLYLLIRCGKSHLALEYAIEQANAIQDSAPNFPRYLQEYLSSPNRIVSPETRAAVFYEYQRMEYARTSASDPYKRLLYKIIGRCELDKMELEDVPQTPFDFVWLQLNLIRERTDDERYTYERYRLVDLQNTIIEKGQSYFEVSESNPWEYFNVLLLSLQFERAVYHLYKNNQFRIQVVHIAILFAYYHLLQIPEEPRTNIVDILIIGHDGSISLNFARLISQYVRVSFPNNPSNALQYQYLLSLFSDLSNVNNEMMTLCREQLCSYIANSNDYKSLIGTQQQPSSGSIESFKPLFGIESEAQYKSDIIHPVAEIFRQQGRYKDAVSVFELGDDYNTAIETLNGHLDQALYRPQDEQANGKDGLLSTPSAHQQRRLEDNQLVLFAKQTLDRYQSRQYILPLVNQSLLTSCYVLTHLLEATLCYEDHKLEDALELIRTINVIPLHNDQLKIQSAAAWFDKSEDNIIRKHIPEILLMVMDILYKLWEHYSNTAYTKFNPSKKPVQEIENAISGLLLFVGLIQMKIPADYVARLNRTDVMLSLNRKV